MPGLCALALDPVAEAPAPLDVLAAVPDPRARRGVRHRLATVLAVTLCPVTAGARSLVAIRRMGR